MISKLGQMLVYSGAITNATLDKALSLQHQNISESIGGLRLGECLVQNFRVPEESIYRTLAFQFGMPFVADLSVHINRDLLEELSFDTFKDCACLPLKKDDDVLSVALCDPIDLAMVLRLEAATGFVIEASVTTPSAINTAKRKLLEGSSLAARSMGKISRDYERLGQSEESLSLEEIKERTESEPVVKMASVIFDEALRLDASDIHIEPSEHGAVVRFRIDGMLTPHMETTKNMYIPLTSRIKIMAELDIAEKRVPQDGRIRYTRDAEMFDFRVSTLPTHYGEKTVIRILKHDMGLLDLSTIGISETEYAELNSLIHKPQGLVFVTGPTGSGKSSTLFACLNRIRDKAINITTIENPIEYKVAGVNQVQINDKAGVTFAATLRSILRQDPDVILIGEIRDRETAEIAVQAAQTGHLVLSTLHTNDSVAAITRLRDLGIPGFLISSSLLAILAQRLVRVLCPSCKRKVVAYSEIEQRWNLMLPGILLPPHFEPAGCDACHKTGFHGRTGIFELATMDEATRGLVSRDANDTELRSHFRKSGMKTMIENGLEKIEQGITSPEELLRVVMVEDIAGLKQRMLEKRKEVQ